ncbi:CCN family member 5-like isoform X2 [Pygocentrus nattereri]|uniref:CCN family member 5-like isoform X2 n=1 Tax=Pygocentrus nattereri TaxID=42514 RepID=UPI0008149D8B|nr:CCN family member 5-like isoform X2 [Pygocentrus nattereri]
MKRESKDAVFPVSLLLCAFSQVVCQLCEGPCQCPWSSPTCPVGVSLVLDGCGCCQMCARQEGKPCSEKYVCDSQHGLQCDYSASFPGGPGECVRQNLLGCELDGVRYEEGQSFQPTCMQLCHCVGGGITCVPLCNEDLNLPIANCPNPRLVQLPGQCCREWVCDSQENSALLENTAAVRVARSWQDMSASSGIPWSNCIEQTTEWSACSRSCGPGVSTRMSNRNWACRPQTQTRLCQVRPCYPAPSAPTSRVQLCLFEALHSRERVCARAATGLPFLFGLSTKAATACAPTGPCSAAHALTTAAVPLTGPEPSGWPSTALREASLSTGSWSSSHVPVIPTVLICH